MTDPTQKLHRTLIRVVRVEPDTESVFQRKTFGPMVEVVVPGYDPHRSVFLHIKHFPAEIQDKLEAGTRLFAWVNIGAEHIWDLRIADEGMELAPELTEEDKL